MCVCTARKQRAMCSAGKQGEANKHWEDIQVLNWWHVEGIFGLHLCCIHKGVPSLLKMMVLVCYESVHRCVICVKSVLLDVIQMQDDTRIILKPFKTITISWSI